MPSDEFSFIGFLPSRQSDRRKALRSIAAEPRTLVLYEAPHRLQDTLEDALEILGNGPAVIARELTKLYEEFLRGYLQDLVEATRRNRREEKSAADWPRDGSAPQLANAENPANAMPLARRVEEIMKERGVDRKAALRQARANAV
jgi:16S rRNA (cytidine1402-2'-O)-methyltransferase